MRQNKVDMTLGVGYSVLTTERGRLYDYGTLRGGDDETVSLRQGYG